MNQVTLESTTDSQSAIDAALGKKSDSVEEQKSVALPENDEAESEETSESEPLENDESEADKDDTAEDEAEDEEKPKKKSGFKKRIERFQRKISEKESEIEYWKREAQKINSQGEVKDEGKGKPRDTDGAPDPGDFDTHREYVEALTEWKIDQREKAREKINHAQKEQEEFRSQVSAFQAKVNDFKKIATDFDEVLASVDDIEISPALQRAVLSSEFSAQLTYELAKNADQLERINSLDQFSMMKEIGKLEAKLEQRKAIEKTKIKTQTKAPPPITPIGSKSKAGSEKNPDDMDFEEYKAYRAAQKRK